MDIMETVEDSFAFLEEVGMVKQQAGASVSYTFPPGRGEGKIEALGDMSKYYFTKSHYSVGTEFSQKYRITERFIEIGKLEQSEGFHTREDGCPDYDDLPVGMAFYIHTSTGAIKWMYCAAGKTCISHSLILRERVYLEWLRPVIERSCPDGVDAFSIIQQAGMANLLLYNSILSELLNNPYQGQAAALLLDAKVLELMASYVNYIESSRGKDVVILSDYDKKAVDEAQRILRTQLKNPPPVAQLARQVGLNQNKMQMAFRQLAGVTAAEYLRSYRMEKALEYLAQDMLLEEVASRVGYKSASRFSEAFMKTYGALPSHYRRLYQSA